MRASDEDGPPDTRGLGLSDGFPAPAVGKPTAAPFPGVPASGRPYRVPVRIATNELLVTDVARGMLERAAAVEPVRVAAERRAFDALRAAYFADPERALNGGGSGGGALAFGLPGVEELLTPVLLAASAEVVRYVADRGAAVTTRGVRRLLGGRPESPEAVEAADDDPAPQPLTAEQWAEVRRIVSRALVRHARMSPQRADLIAAAVVGDGLAGDDQQ